MTIYHDFVQQANRLLEKEESKADAVAKVRSSSEDSTLSMRPKEGDASTFSQRGVSRDLDTEMTSGPDPSNTSMTQVGLFPKSRFGVGTKFTFQTPTSNTWTIRQKVSQNNHQVEELDTDDVDFHVSEAQTTFFVSNDSDPNGPLAYMHPQKFDKGFIEMARLDYLSWDVGADDLVWDPVASKFWFIDFRTAMEVRWRVPKHPSLHQKNYATDADLRPMFLTWKR
ncbi:hypothetical protein N7541_006114 [Penicillium brevicompactum]|uniref:Uncharacterized protein n=1 Tax=Penicillium brevicompactum TaxID=5074 RepID=A0A9W9R612_PENBR|nr:hypothetical protein N7541_006114 [Penicillium brevicompactum]